MDMLSRFWMICINGRRLLIVPQEMAIYCKIAGINYHFFIVFFVCQTPFSNEFRFYICVYFLYNEDARADEVLEVLCDVCFRRKY